MQSFQMHSLAFYLQVSHHTKKSKAPGLPLGGGCSAPWPPGACRRSLRSQLRATGRVVSRISPEQERWSCSSPRPSVLTGAVGVIALPALGPGPSALGAAVGRRRALPAPLLGAVGAGHRALAPRAPLLPLSVHCRGRHKRDGHSRVNT